MMFDIMPRRTHVHSAPRFHDTHNGNARGFAVGAGQEIVEPALDLRWPYIVFRRGVPFETIA
jgi:hypothetical protein